MKQRTHTPRALLCMIALFAVLSARLFAGGVHSVIDGETPMLLGDKEMRFSLRADYETGDILARLIRPTWSVGMWNAFEASLSLAVGTLDHVPTLPEASLSVKYALYDSPPAMLSLYPYLSYRQSLGSPVIIPYEGALDGVAAVISPHADGGSDIALGMLARYTLPVFDKAFTAHIRGEYAFTPNYAFAYDAGALHRGTLSLTACYTPDFPDEVPFLKQGDLFFALEQRGIFWSGRGFSYDIWTTLSFTVWDDLAFSIGAKFPVIGGGVFGYYAKAEYRLAPTRIACDITSEPSVIFFNADGVPSSIVLYPSVSSLRPIDSWQIIISDEEGAPFKVFSGKGTPPKALLWKGYSDEGNAVLPLKNYGVSFVVENDKGQKAHSATQIPAAGTPKVYAEIDFLIVRYTWTEANGKDLDTRTTILAPPRNVILGWSRETSDSNYMTWNNDNTGEGCESVLVDVRALAEDYPDVTVIDVALAAFWYSERRNGDYRVEFLGYKGGEMVADEYDFRNIGGAFVAGISVIRNSSMTNEGAPKELDGERGGIARYDRSAMLFRILSSNEHEYYN